MNEQPTLLPCPFCGYEAEQPNPDHPHGGMVVCKSCGASAFGPKWNRRAEVARLTAERDRILWRANVYRDRFDRAQELYEQTCAERDALRATLERIRDDGAGWQRDTARDALASDAAEEWREIEQARQPRLDEGYTAVRISKPGFWLVKGPGPATAYSSTSDQKTAVWKHLAHFYA